MTLHYQFDKLVKKMKSDEEGKVVGELFFREPGMVEKGKQCRRKAPPSGKRKTKLARKSQS